MATNLGDGNIILMCSSSHPAVTYSEDRSRNSCKRCRRRKKSRANDEVNGVANGLANRHASDVEINGSPVCMGHSENESNTKESTLEFENESCHL